MRQEQERFDLSDRGGAPDGAPLGVDTNPPRRSSTLRDEPIRLSSRPKPSGSDSNEWNHIDTSGETGLFQRHSGETHSARLLQNQERLRFRPCQNDKERIEDNRESREEEVPQKTYVQKPDGFEPFINQEPQENNLFVNNYGGAYSQKMELNRSRVERALKMAHLEGKVFLTNFQPNRSRAEAQGNELAAKRFLLFERKTQKVEEENPYKRVVSVPEGWRIEINDTRITEELTEERELTGKKLQRAFINRFNTQLREGLKECVWREKCSSEKDPHFRYKLFWSGTHAVSPFVWATPLLITNPSLIVPFVLGVTLLVYGPMNTILEQRNRSFRNIEDILKDINPSFKPSSFSSHRKIDHPLEYFMPYVEIDKVARTFAYLSGKGRRLVREVEREG